MRCITCSGAALDGVAAASVDSVFASNVYEHFPSREDVAQSLAEVRRVLRPGGQVIISDIHPQATLTGAIAAFPGRDLSRGVPYVRSVVHQLGEYLAAFRAAGLSVVDCLEPSVDEDVVTSTPSFAVYPEAARQAFYGMPYLLVWRLIK